jgi:hypothetical protein
MGAGVHGCRLGDRTCALPPYSVEFIVDNAAAARGRLRGKFEPVPRDFESAALDRKRPGTDRIDSRTTATDDWGKG